MNWFGLACLAFGATATVFFTEEFGEDWESRWVQSTADEFARFKITPGWWYLDEKDLGIEAAKGFVNYAVSAKFPAFSNENRTLVVQYTVKIQQQLDCGGAFIKLLGEDLVQEHFSSKTDFVLMFGADVCEDKAETKFIFRHGQKSYSLKKGMKALLDTYTHQYTLGIFPDNSFVFFIDNVQEEQGKMEEVFELDEGVDREKLYLLPRIGAVGIEIMSTTPGTHYDSFFIGDSLSEAQEYSQRTFAYKKKDEWIVKKKEDDRIEKLKKEATKGFKFEL